MTESSRVSERRVREVGERDAEQAETEELESCPDCDGRLVVDESQGERHCEDCGRIVEADTFDRGPEWRAFTQREKEQKSRVGAPETQLLHDKGLSTQIGWRDEDARGNSLSGRKRRQIQRLRTWNERYRATDSRDRNLRQALGEIDRMASALGLPTSVRETASVMYRRALEEDLLPGRSIEGVATAALYTAARLDGVARSLDEMVVVSRVDELELQRTYSYVSRELGLEVPPTHPREYIGRFASGLDCTDETERKARELVEAAVEEGVHSGKHPVGIAASALYGAGQLTGEEMTQNEVSDVANVSKVTIRNRYREVMRAALGEPDS
jgi:transcription initiation factor TFIIB